MALSNKIQFAFAIALIIGTTGLVAGFIDVLQPVSISVPILSLVMYVIVGNRIHRDEIPTRQFGDSAYYLGFMFTLGALMVSILALSFSDEANISALLGRFAVALITTMGGLLARLWIVNLSGAEGTAVDEAQRALAEQSERYRQELHNLTTGLIAEGHNVHESVTQVTKEMAAISRQTMEETSSIIKESSEEASAVLTEKAGQALTIGEKVLKKVVLRIDDVFTRFEQTVVDQTQQLNRSFAMLVHKVSQTNLPKNLLTKSLEPAINQLNASIRGLSGSIDNIASTMTSVEHAAEAIEEHIDSVGRSMEEIRGACEGAASQLGEVQQLGQALNGVQRCLNQLKPGLDELQVQLEQYTQVCSEATHAHKAHVKAIEEHTEKMKTALEEADGMVTQVGNEMVAAAKFVRQQLERH